MILAAAIAVNSLLAGLEGVDSVREMAIDSLTDSSDAVVLAILEYAGWRGRDAAIAALERSVPPRVGRLLDAAKEHPKLAARRSAIRSLGRVGPTGVCDSLVTLFGHGSDAVILDAITGRRDCDISRVVPFLASPDNDVRRRALSAHTRLDTTSRAPVALRFLQDPDRGVRRAAGAILAEHSEAILAIGHEMDSLTTTGRSEVLRVLGEIGGPEAERLLIASLDDEQWPHRYLAGEGLVQAGTRASLESIRDRVSTESHPLVLEILWVAEKRLSTDAK